MKKSSTSILISFIILNFFLPFGVILMSAGELLQTNKAEAATPQIRLIEVLQSSVDKKWTWTFEITTSTVPDGTAARIYVYKGSTNVVPPQTVYIQSNFYLYSTTSVLEDKTNYLIMFNPASGTALNFSGTTGSVVPQSKTIKDTNLIMAGNGNTAIGAQKPADISPQTNNTPTPNVYKLLAPIGSFTQAPDDIGSYFNTIIKIAIGLCAVLAVIMIVIGGIQYMGDESIFGKTEAKSQITKAILGLLIALGSYAILNTINPDLLGKNGATIQTLQTVIDNETETIPWEGYSNTGDTTACPEGFIDVLIGGNKNNKINVCNSVADELTYMINAAQRAGIILSGSGTRSTAQQQALRVANGCADPALPSTSCNPQTARPGHSMHQAGKAVDFKCNGKQVTRSDACYQWLTINAGKTYGFYNLPSEPWHWSTTGK